ncbi:MAG: hypothetical protein RMK99_02225 [Anaerolineales bacterium]|nr:hypothetical protein [Anaerolineales bacterium]
MTLADVVYRIATDSAFAARLEREPRQTLAAASLTLGEEQLKAVLAVLHGKARWQDLCSPAWIVPEVAAWDRPLNLSSILPTP